MVVGGVSLFPETAEAIVMGPSMQKLTWHYYKVYNTCENAENFVRHQVEIFYKNDKSIAPKLLRLLYSDCFVSGCDASVLLEGPNSEKMAPQNRGLGGFVLIDKIKIVLEQRCPGVVSCADILNLATRDAVHLVISLSSAPIAVHGSLIDTDQLRELIHSGGCTILSCVHRQERWFDV
jgi:peroxidase